MRARQYIINHGWINSISTKKINDTIILMESYSQHQAVNFAEWMFKNGFRAFDDDGSTWLNNYPINQGIVYTTAQVWDRYLEENQ